MKKLVYYLIVFIFVILLRDNICFFYGNILGIFKLDNNYYEGIIKLKDERIEYLENEINNLNDFSSNLILLDYKYTVSKILYKKTYNTNKYLIQYGKKNNINKGLAVTNENGLIGRIYKVNNNTSEIVTLKSIKNLSVLINESIGKLNYDKDTDLFIINDISNYDKVHINDEVYTSGYGTIKEKLYIGNVVKIVNKDFKKTLYIKSKVDFNNLNYILIVGDNNVFNN